MMLVTELMEGGNLSNNISHGRVTWYKRGKKVSSAHASMRCSVWLHAID